jgi:pentapeptide MXKDX repeat protein
LVRIFSHLIVGSKVEGGSVGKQHLLRRTPDFGRASGSEVCQQYVETPIPAEILLSPQKCLSRVRYKAEIGRTAGNKRPAGCVGHDSGERRFQPTVSNKDDHLMNTRSRIALGVSAALVSLSLALAPSFAEDKMGKDAMKKEDSMSKDAMKKDDGMMKKDGMTKSNAMSDGMKKDDGMKKN